MSPMSSISSRTSAPQRCELVADGADVSPRTFDLGGIRELCLPDVFFPIQT